MYNILSAIIVTPFLLFAVCMTPDAYVFNDKEDRAELGHVENSDFSVTAYFNRRYRGMGESYSSIEYIDKSSFLKAENTIWSSYNIYHFDLTQLDENSFTINYKNICDTLYLIKDSLQNYSENRQNRSQKIAIKDDSFSHDRLLAENSDYQYISRTYYVPNSSIVDEVRLVAKDIQSPNQREYSLIRVGENGYFTVNIYKDSSIMAYVHLKEVTYTDSLKQNSNATVNVIMHAFDIEDYSNPEIIY